MSFVQKIRKIIEKKFSFIQEKKLLLAVSGGKDSMAMAFALAELRDYFGFELSALHVNHNLRAESVDEALFVLTELGKIGIPCVLKEIPLDFWNDDANMENRARDERYGLIKECFEVQHSDYLLTAHHQDDQVETLLMRIFDRGSGIRGLCGILPENDMLDMPILRILLDISRMEIEKYMENKLFVEDSSNNDTKILRNYFRRDVVPALDSLLNKDWRSNILRLSENAFSETVFSKHAALFFWDSLSYSDSESKCWYISRIVIAKYPDEFWLTAFSYLFSAERGFSFSRKTLEDILKFIKKHDPGISSYSPFVFERDTKGVLILKKGFVEFKINSAR